MKTIILLFITSLSLHSLYGQTLESEAVSNGGDDFQHAGIFMSWTMGEIVTKTLGSNLILTQGFQQPDATYFGNISHVPTTNARITDFENFEEEISNSDETTLKLYPNPVSGAELLIFLDSYEGTVDYAITNTLGQEVQHGTLKQFNQSERISVTRLSVGLYILKIQTTLGEQTQKFILNK